MEKEIVIYEGKEWTIYHDYGNGFCEIEEINSKKIDLVRKEDLTYTNRNLQKN